MDSVLRAVVVYAFLLAVFRLAGKRSLAQITTFDFVLLLIIGEASQQALVGEDYSVTTAFVVIATLVALELALSRAAADRPSINRAIESLPLVILEDGRPLDDRLAQERLDVSEILSAARELHGLERLDQIKYAVLERGGDITIVPKRSGGGT